MVPKPQSMIAAATTPGKTIAAFFGVLAFALPYFIFSKRANDTKRKERHMGLLKQGAFSSMNNGPKVYVPPVDRK